MADFPKSFGYKLSFLIVVLLPRPLGRFGLSLFARRYLGNLSYFLFLQLLRCFNSLGFLLLMLQ